MIELISPAGGKLVDLIVPPDERGESAKYAGTLRSIQLTKRNACDLELLACGGFSPLEQFMSEVDYKCVLDEMRLSDGTIFPIPVTLSVDDSFKIGETVVLRSESNEILALLEIEEIYCWDKEEFAEKVLSTKDSRHPLVAEIQEWGKFNLSGKLRVLRPPKHFDNQDLRLTPSETREQLKKFGNRRVIAFQTRNPLHRAHEEMMKRAMRETDGILFLHPVVGMTKAGDISHFFRVRTYKVLAENYFPENQIFLALLPLAMRLAGAREAVWHALVRRNYGANYFIVGRDHASPGLDSNGNPFYSPLEAQALAKKFGAELGVEFLCFDEFVYLSDENRFEEKSKISPESKILSLSGTQVREEYLKKGKSLPEWFTRPEVAEILAESFPARERQGVCLWFTGLSGAGKSTTAEILTTLLLEKGRQNTLLDGDVVRTNLSKGLGFSREDRDANVRRIGFVASEIVRYGGVAVCAAVSPYLSTRDEVRNLVGGENFVEIFVSTPLEICEKRDTKGLYAQARRGEIKNFTGISDAYEPPTRAEITIDSANVSPEENARRILAHLIEKGFVREK
jgi:sulfate adenylyltransferase